MVKRIFVRLISLLLAAAAVVTTLSSFSGDEDVFAEGNGRRTLTGLVGELLGE